MATKKQLEKQAADAGIEVPSGANKADIEKLLADNNVEVDGADVEWFKTVDTGVVFAAAKGTPLHKRVTSKRQAANYERTTKPSKRGS